MSGTPRNFRFRIRLPRSFERCGMDAPREEGQDRTGFIARDPAEAHEARQVHQLDMAR
jgi:hypothetical protein